MKLYEFDPVDALRIEADVRKYQPTARIDVEYSHMNLWYATARNNGVTNYYTYLIINGELVRQ